MDKKWNLQDIRPSDTSAKRAPKRASKQTAQKSASSSRREPTRRRGGHSRLLLFAGIAAVIIGGGALFVGFFYSGTTVTIQPQRETQTINATFTAYNEPAAAQLGYETITLTASDQRLLTATGEETVTEQATGEIIIENTGDTSERLIKNTRFESENGYVFRTTESVVVPKAETVDGEQVPGRVVANVFADEVGEEYNIDPTSFTIPGYAENGFDTLFEQVTGRSETPMSGGFDGVAYSVKDEELADAKEALHSELESVLRERVKEERPAGFILYPESIVFSYETEQAEAQAEGEVAIVETVTLTAPLFKEDAFAAYLASQTVLGYEDEPIRIDAPHSLTFAYAATGTPVTDMTTSIEFSLSGQAAFVWTFDEEQLATDLAGKSETALETVLTGYPAIERAEAEIRPFWKRSFSEDADDITITEAAPDLSERNN